MNQSKNANYVNLLQIIARMLNEESTNSAYVSTSSIPYDGAWRMLSTIISTDPARVIELAALEGLYGAKFSHVIDNKYCVYWPHPVFSDELYATYGEGVDPN